MHFCLVIQELMLKMLTMVVYVCIYINIGMIYKYLLRMYICCYRAKNHCSSTYTHLSKVLLLRIFIPYHTVT